MKKAIIYKIERVYNRTYEWSTIYIWNDWDKIYSDAYEVLIPDRFFIRGTGIDREIVEVLENGEERTAYIETKAIHDFNCKPYLLASNLRESIKLEILKEVKGFEE